MEYRKIVSKLSGAAILTGVVFLVLFLSYVRFFDVFELKLLDLRYHLRPAPKISDKIVLIDISDDTIKQLGEWPINRGYHAAVIRALKYGGARQIIFDMLFSEEKGEEDTDFAAAIKDAGNVYMPNAYILRTDGVSELPLSNQFDSELLDGFESLCKGIGNINVVPDIDGNFRKIPPFINFKGELVPFVTFLAGVNYLGYSIGQVEIKPAAYVDVAGDFRIPLDSTSSIIVNIPGKWENTFRHYSYVDVLKTFFAEGPEKEKLKAFKDCVCFIAATAAGIGDINPSPFETIYPGVGLHASLMNSMMYRKFITRAGRWTNLAILAVLFAATYLSTLVRKKRFSLLIAVCIPVVFFAAGVALFAFYRVWIDLFYPIVVVTLYYLWATFNKYIFEMHKRELLENELSIAKNIQQSFLPKEGLKVKGLDVVAMMVTARQVGGDLYDYVDTDEHRAGVMIGDVSGKGVPAALYMAKVVSEFRIFTDEESPATCLCKLNDRLSRESGANLFVTVAYVMFDTDKMTAKFSLGGHLPVIMMREGENSPILLDSRDGMPLGLMGSCPFSDDAVGLKKGDLFVFYTDGVTEAMNQKNEMFEQQRLVDLVTANRDLPTRKLVELIHAEVAKFEGKGHQHDDITVIAVRIN